MNTRMTERFMAGFARQANDNKVVGINLVALARNLLLFEQVVIPTIWFEDIQLLAGFTDVSALCEMMASGSISFYVDTATTAETGQVRADMRFTGRNSRLRDNEFAFSTIKGRDDLLKAKQGLNNISLDLSLPVQARKRLAYLCESCLLESQGLPLHAEAHRKAFEILRKAGSEVLKSVLRSKLNKQGISLKVLDVSVNEFYLEEFRVETNLRSCGISPAKERQIVMRCLFDVIAAYNRQEHMRALNCLVSMNDVEVDSWSLATDAITGTLLHEADRERQFSRVLHVAGLGEGALVSAGELNLHKILELRGSEELRVFRSWLKESDQKSGAEIRDRVLSLRSKIGNSAQSHLGKSLRLLFSLAPALLANPLVSTLTGLALSAADTFGLERAFPQDAVVSFVSKDYPKVFRS